jgi:hypothetical protein
LPSVWETLASEQLKSLTVTIAHLSERLERTEGQLAISTNANKLLAERVANLEHGMVENERATTNCGQYMRNRQLEIKRLPEGISNQPVAVLKSSMASLLSLTEANVSPNDIGKCHKLGKNGDSVILELNSREIRDSILTGRKLLRNKAEQLRDMGFYKVMILESMCKEYGRLAFICRQLKKQGSIEETWFFNGRLFIKKSVNGEKSLITHIVDLYEKVGRDVVSRIC